LINQDESFLVDEDLVHVSKPHTSGDVIKVLKSFNNSIQAKELRIKELENSLKATQETLKKFEKQNKNNFDLLDISSLLEKYGLEERFTTAMKQFDIDCEAKMSKLNQRIDTLNVEKIKNLQEIVQGYKKELEQSKMMGEDLAAQLHSKDTRLRAINQEIQEIESQRLYLKTKVDELDQEIKTMRSQDKLAEAEIIDLNEQLRAKEDQMIEFYQIMQDKERRIADLEVQVREGESFIEFAKANSNVNEQIINNCKTQIMNLWEKLAEKENQINTLTKFNQELTTQLEDHAKDGRQSDQHNLSMDSLVGEFGNFIGLASSQPTIIIGDAIINMYISLFGKKGEESLKRDCFDLGEICALIIDFIKSSMIKVDDLTLGDRVVGVKLPGIKSHHYQIIYIDAHQNNILYTYQAPQE